MGLLTSIFVGDAENPPDAEKEPEVPDGEGIQLKSITSLNLSMLWAIIDAVAWTPDRMDGFEMIGEPNEGPGLERCPTGLAESLRAADEMDLDMAGATLGFRRSVYNLNQTQVVKPHSDGRSDLPLTRADWHV